MQNTAAAFCLQLRRDAGPYRLRDLELMIRAAVTDLFLVETLFSASHTHQNKNTSKISLQWSRANFRWSQYTHTHAECCCSVPFAVSSGSGALSSLRSRADYTCRSHWHLSCRDPIISQPRHRDKKLFLHSRYTSAGPTHQDRKLFRYSR